MQTAFKPFSPKQNWLYAGGHCHSIRIMMRLSVMELSEVGKLSVCRWDLSAGQQLAFKALPLLSAEKPLLPYGEMW